MILSDRILTYLQSIAPARATNSDIRAQLGEAYHATVYQTTQLLANRGQIQAERNGTEWAFWVEAGETESTQPEPPPKHTGNEQFHQSGHSLGFDVLSFWQWSSSDLLNNAMRGLVAEYLVARAVGTVNSPRVEWDAYDAITPAGIRVEVKSAAYVQSWEQTRPSIISFNIRETTAWDAKTNNWTATRRQADVYVFCLLAHEDKRTIDPLDLDQWRFYVIATVRLNAELGTQKSLGLARLLSIGAHETAYSDLAVRIAELGATTV